MPRFKTSLALYAALLTGPLVALPSAAAHEALAPHQRAIVESKSPPPVDAAAVTGRGAGARTPESSRSRRACIYIKYILF